MGNLHLVTGYSGQPHVTAADHGSLFEALIRSGQFVMDAGAKFAASVITNNQIRVSDGELMMQGRHVKLAPGAYVDLTIENGASGYLRNDLIAVRYTKNNNTGIEECSLVVIKGTPAESKPSDPEYTIGNINAKGDLQHDFPLYRVPLSGLNVGELKAMFEPQKSIFDYALKSFAPSGYGLGEMQGTLTPIEDAHQIWKTGWYFVATGITANTPATGVLRAEVYAYAYMHLTLYTIAYSNDGSTTIIHQDLANGVWKDWEFENPPMVPGEEYRTTKRYKGVSVYEKVDTNGNIIWRAENETTWHLLASSGSIANATVE